MDAPPGRGGRWPVSAGRAMLLEIGVNAPRVLSAPSEGFLLLTDLGTRIYLPELSPGRGGPTRCTATRSMRWCGSSRGASCTRGLPPYDEKLLRFEMSLFPDWLLQRHLGLGLSRHEAEMLADAMDALVANALGQPQVFVHRDYHSRNLMVCPGAQSRASSISRTRCAAPSPTTWCRCCVTAISRGHRSAWSTGRCSSAARRAAAGLAAGRDDAQFLRWFDLMGVQRHLKVRWHLRAALSSGRQGGVPAGYSAHAAVRGGFVRTPRGLRRARALDRAAGVARGSKAEVATRGRALDARRSPGSARMRAMILAAGPRRAHAAADAGPAQTAARVGGRALIEHHLRRARCGGISRRRHQSVVAG